MPSHNVTVAREVLEKWVPKFGFGNYTWNVRRVSTPDSGCWGRSVFLHEDEHFEVEIGDQLDDRQVETVILHELAHGLLSLAETSQNAVEVVCNRIARLLLGRKTALPNRDWLREQVEWDFFMAVLPEMDAATRNGLVRYVVDFVLTGEEREVINALFYERASYGEIARRLGIERWEVQRIEQRAKKPIREFIENLEAMGRE